MGSARHIFAFREKNRNTVGVIGIDASYVEVPRSKCSMSQATISYNIQPAVSHLGSAISQFNLQELPVLCHLY